MLKLVVGLIASMFVGLGAAHATAITGLIDFTGSNFYSLTAKTITFVNPADVTSDTGTLATFGSCNACATFKNVNFATFVPTTNEIVAMNAGKTFALDLDSVTFASSSANFLDVQGGATLHLTGFAATPGEFFFSTQGPQNIEVSFSTTAVPTAEPAGIAILGVGLLGMGLVRRRGLFAS